MILKKDVEAILANPGAVQDLTRLYNERYTDADAHARYKAAVKAFQVQIENVKLHGGK